MSFDLFISFLLSLQVDLISPAPIELFVFGNNGALWPPNRM